MRKYAYTGPKGTEVVLEDSLVAIADKMLPMVRSAYKASVGLETSYRGIADLLLPVRLANAYVPKKTPKTVTHNESAALLTDSFLAGLPRSEKNSNYIIPASDIDWTGSSIESTQAEEALWSAVFAALNISVETWAMVTNKPASNFPIKVGVNYHLHRAIKARFLSDHNGDENAAQAAYVIATGNIWEEPGKERTAAVKAIRDALDAGSNVGGEADQKEKEKPVKQDLEAVLASIQERLNGISVKGLKAPARLSAHNMLNSINLTVQVLLSETKTVVRTKSDPRRVRAADASN